MGFLELIILAGALAIDAFSVGASVGLIHNTRREIFRLSLHFGVFQSLMTLVGYLAGWLILGYIKDYDHWVIFLILTFIGAHFILNAIRNKTDCCEVELKNLTKGYSLVMLSFSVSLDALGVGIGLRAIEVNIVLALLIIGLISFLATIFAMNLAKRINIKYRRVTFFITGIVLILLGLKILIEHLKVI